MTKMFVFVCNSIEKQQKMNFFSPFIEKNKDLFALSPFIPYICTCFKATKPHFMGKVGLFSQ